MDHFAMCMTYVLFYTMISIVISTNNTISSWNIEYNLPEPMAQMVVGYDSVTHQIYIIGGCNLVAADSCWTAPMTNIYSFDLNINQFELLPNLELNGHKYAYSATQFYTSINRTIYFADSHYGHLQAFDMQHLTHTYIDNPNITNKFSNPSVTKDLSENYLYVIGGYKWSPTTENFSNKLSIYKYNNDQWISIDGANMKTPRLEHSCIVSSVNNFLYCFGGVTYGWIFLNTIEKIDTTNIYENNWEIIDTKLKQPITAMRVIEMNKLIYIIGGKLITGNAVDIVHIFKITETSPGIYTEEMFVGTSLKQAVFQQGIVKVNDIIFLFGGRSKDDTVLSVLQTSISNYSLQTTTKPFTTTVANTSMPSYTAPPTTSPTIRKQQERTNDWNRKKIIVISSVIGICMVIIVVGIIFYLKCIKSKTKLIKQTTPNSASEGQNNDEVEMLVAKEGAQKSVTPGETQYL